MNRQWLAVGSIVAVLLGLIGAGWFVRDRIFPLDVGNPAPGFTAYDLQGRKVGLNDLAGEVVLLNIWATWCGPCRDEMPSMERLHQILGPEGLRIVAVSVDAVGGTVDDTGKPGGDVAEFASEFGLSFDIWQDPSGRIQRTYRTTGIPESFVIDRSGIIVRKDIGATYWDTDARIASLRRLLEQ